MSHAAALQQHDFGTAMTFDCDVPLYSRIPFRYAFYAAYDHLTAWVRDGNPPPIAQPIDLVSAEPEVIVARDSLGNAFGGIRLPQHAVPTATNRGDNSGQQFCILFGSHVPFDSATLTALYPTHEEYVEAFNEAVQENLEAGYILSVDAEKMIAEARQAMGGW